MNIFVFDIETVPDVETGRKLLNLNDLSDLEVANAMFAKTRADSGSEFMRHHLQKIVAISAVFRQKDIKSNKETLTVWSLGDENSTESELITRFFSGLDKFAPTLVSWNGGGFDLPVLHYRALYHGISAPTYWEVGDKNQNFKWNNYLSRYHRKHLDLMDVLSGYQMRSVAKLDEMAVMLGFPGKLGMDGSHVWEAFQQGEIKQIRDYCETDVLNTYLIYLRFELMRGNLTQTQYEEECILVHNTLEQSSQPHLQQFLAAWQ